MGNSGELVQIEAVDSVCASCGVRHMPLWLEETLETADRELRHMLLGDPNPNWFNFHKIKKRAFVPLEKYGRGATR